MRTAPSITRVDACADVRCCRGDLQAMLGRRRQFSKCGDLLITWWNGKQIAFTCRSTSEISFVRVESKNNNARSRALAEINSITCMRCVGIALRSDDGTKTAAP